MEMIYKDAAHIYLPNSDESVKKYLTYQDKSVQFMISKLKKQFKFSHSEWALKRMEELKREVDKTLLWYDEEDRPYTLAGLHKMLGTRFGWTLRPLEYSINGRPIPYAKHPKFKNRYYQDEAFEAMIANRHCAIELPTSAGKSALIRDLCKHEPVQTVVMAPSSSIADQLYNEFVRLFGVKWVGFYGSGKKQLNKLFTIAIAQSLVKVKEGTPAWDYFSKTKKIAFDESHQCPASTFQEVCLGLFKDTPQKYFVSATQTRTDGSEIVLLGITGPIVYRKLFRELVAEKFLSNPNVKIFHVAPTTGVNNSDPKTETRNQIYYNSNVAVTAANIANKMYNNGKQTVIVLEEFRQFDLIRNLISVPFVFLHGGVSKDAQEFVPQEYWKSPDIPSEVDKFNDGKTRLIIGTSAIATGTDFIPVDCLINLRGGISEIAVKQTLGRGTRIGKDKFNFFYVDFCIDGSKTMERHSAAREGIYAELTDTIEHIRK
jgi:superfamily II DNA or RNA helicase